MTAATRKIIPETLIALWAEGKTMDEIAGHFRCDRTTVARVVKRMREKGADLPNRRAGPAVVQAVVRLPENTPPEPTESPLAGSEDFRAISMRAELKATGGRYSALCAWADKFGLSYTAALQRWHRLQLPLERKA